MRRHKIDYELAFAFRNTRIWKKVFEDELFAIRLPCRGKGKIGYCCITGREGVHKAISVYIGAAGLNTLRKVLRVYDETADEDTHDVSQLLIHDCVQCSIEAADEFDDEELEEVMEYARAHKLRAPYPRFRRHRPHTIPWYIQDKKDWDAIEKGLRITVALSEALASHKKAELGIGDAGLADIPGFFRAFEEPTIPLFELDASGKLTMERVPLPPDEPETYPKPKHLNELDMAKLKKAGKMGTLQCEVVRLPSPVQDVENEAPYLPAVMLAVQEDTGMVLPVYLVPGADYDPDEMASAFMQSLLKSDIYPDRIAVGNEEAAAILEELCERTGILLVRDDELPELEEARESLMAHMRGEDISSHSDRLREMIDTLMRMSMDELRTMPDEVREMLASMMDRGLLPEELVKRLKKL